MCFSLFNISIALLGFDLVKKAKTTHQCTLEAFNNDYDFKNSFLQLHRGGKIFS